MGLHVYSPDNIPKNSNNNYLVIFQIAQSGLSFIGIFCY